MIRERDDILYGDVVVEAALVFGVLETQGGIDVVTGMEFAEGGVSEKGAGV